MPVTVHAGIGYDILHEHPNCDGAALGAASYRDFLIFAAHGGTPGRRRDAQLRLGGDGPEVYLKALAMARNVAHQEGRAIRHFATAVFDLVPLDGDIHSELPKTDPGLLLPAARRRSWCAPWPTAARATTSAATTAPPSRPCGAPSWNAHDHRGNSGGVAAAFARWWWAISVSTAGAPTIPALAEPSRETGIPRIGVVATEVTPGAGGTVANNLAALGVGRVAVLGAIGDDGFGYELSRALGRARHLLRAVRSQRSASRRSPTPSSSTPTTGVEDQPRVDFINTAPLPRERRAR